MEAFAETHDGSVQMIDTSIVRVHQHGAAQKKLKQIKPKVAPVAD